MTDLKLGVNTDNISEELLAVARGISEAVSSAEASVAEVKKAEARVAEDIERLGIVQPTQINGLADFKQAIFKAEIQGGDLVTDKQGNKYIFLKRDKVWNDHPDMLANTYTGRVVAGSSLHFPVIVEV